MAEERGDHRLDTRGRVLSLLRSAMEPTAAHTSTEVGRPLTLLGIPGLSTWVPAAGSARASGDAVRSARWTRGRDRALSVPVQVIGRCQTVWDPAEAD